MSRKRISVERVALLSALIVLVGLASITFSGTIEGVKTKALKIRSGGSVKIVTPPGVEVGVYWDRGCSSLASSIDWGSIEPGSSKAVTVYIKNTGNTAITLYLETTNWVPEAASNYMDLSWNYGGRSVSPNEVIQVTLTLSVSSSIEGITTFSFDVVITASG